MPAGPVTITVNYAARFGVTLTSCAFTPYFNGASLDQITPSDYNINKIILTSNLSTYK